MIDVSIIIVSYNTKDLLLKCMRSVKQFTEDVSYEVIVVDNNSSDGSVEAIRNFKLQISNFKLISNGDNRGFGVANNQGIKNSKGRYILLLNPDTELIEDSITKMVSWMDKHENVGIASCKLVNADGTIQPTGGFFPNIGRVFLWSTLVDDIPPLGSIFGSYHPKAGFYKKEREFDWVTGAFFLIRRKVIDDIKGFDEDYFLYVEEVDLCYRAKKRGWEVYYIPITSIIHHKGASGTTENMIIREFQGLKLFYKKHYSAVEGWLFKTFLIYGCLVRIILFAIIKPKKAKIYARAITKI